MLDRQVVEEFLDCQLEGLEIPEEISKNEEINNIKKILGLQTGTKNVKELRYSKIMVMTDQDTDGFHIKSLLINFIDSGWPDLLKKSIFVESLLTPIIKVSRRNYTVFRHHTKRNV